MYDYLPGGNVLYYDIDEEPSYNLPFRIKLSKDFVSSPESEATIAQIKNDVLESIQNLSTRAYFNNLSAGNKEIFMEDLRSTLLSIGDEEANKFLHEYPEVKEFLDKNPE